MIIIFQKISSESISFQEIPFFLAAANKYHQYSPIKSYPQSLHPVIPHFRWSPRHLLINPEFLMVHFQVQHSAIHEKTSYPMIIRHVSCRNGTSRHIPIKTQHQISGITTPWLNGHETHHLWCFNHVQCPMFPSFLIVKSHCSSIFHPFLMVNSPIFPCNDACFAHLSWFNQFNPPFSRVKSHGKPLWESPAPPPAPSPARRLPGAVSRHRRLKASEIGILTVKNGKFTTKNMDLVWVYHELAFFWIWSWKVGIERWQNQDFSQRNGEMIGSYGRWNTSQTTVLNPGMECSSKVRDKPQYPNKQVGLWPGSEFSFLMFMVRKSMLRQIWSS